MKRLIVYSAVAAFLFMAADISICFIYPNVSSLKKEHFEKTAFMKHRERQWAKKGVDKKIRHKWVPFRKISPYLVKAVIIAEDDKFWNHEGFDFIAMQRALKKDIEHKKFKAGGSTITQQLAKNLYLSPSKNPVRKINEAIYAWRLERTLSKKRIVELYLNAAEWGDGIFGIQAAARHYYKKNASALTAHEASRLASVLPNPLRFNPKGTSKFVKNRSTRIFLIMVRRGIVIPEFEEVMKAPDEPEAHREESLLDSLLGWADTTGASAPADEAQSAQETFGAASNADTSGLQMPPAEPASQEPAVMPAPPEEPPPLQPADPGAPGSTPGP